MTAGNIGAAKAELDKARNVPDANHFSEVDLLASAIDSGTDEGMVPDELMGLSDPEFDQFREDHTLPVSLASGFDGLERHTIQLALAAVPRVANAREARRQAEIEAERRRKEEKAQRRERERLVAEAAQRQAAAAAAREPELQRQAKARDKILLDSFIGQVDPNFVKRVSMKRISSSLQLTITVSNIWHIRAYQIRLQDAQTLWEIWARIASPSELDSARIKIVDLRGNEVGGSRVLAGSLIWVQKE